MDKDNRIRITAWIIFIIIWAGLNYYIGSRIWLVLGYLIPGYQYWYWGGLTFLAASYIIGRLQNVIYWGRISKWLYWIGSYWLAAFFYTLLALLMFDVIKYLDNWFGFIPVTLKVHPVAVALAVGAIIVVLLIYGSYKANKPVFQQYFVNIAKPAANLKQLHIVTISDMHLGHIVNNRRLEALVDQVNQRQPDLILLLGDVIEEDVRPFLEQGMLTSLKKLTSRLGTFAVLGNHEYTGGQYQQIVACLKAAGITVLCDQWQLISDSLYLVGRDDRHRQQRLTLEQIIAGIDVKLPIILMDHNPADLKGARTNRVDLQLSGHTHRGQFWPLQLITERIFEIDWGYLNKDGLQLIVSSGFGTWGPPIRIGSTPEIVEIFISFGEPAINEFSFADVITDNINLKSWPAFADQGH